MPLEAVWSGLLATACRSGRPDQIGKEGKIQILKSMQLLCTAGVEAICCS